MLFFYFSSPAANELWNNLLEPVGFKTVQHFPLYRRFLCPTEKAPYFFTKENSERFLRTGKQWWMLAYTNRCWINLTVPDNYLIIHVYLVRIIYLSLLIIISVKQAVCKCDFKVRFSLFCCLHDSLMSWTFQSRTAFDRSN